MNASRISAAITTLPATPSQNSTSEGASPSASLINKVADAKTLFAAAVFALSPVSRFAMLGAVKNLITR